MTTRAFSPDGRAWSVVHRPDPPGLLQKFRPSGDWLVEATTGDETRRWMTSSRREARQLVIEVALALRTGAEGPPGELPTDSNPGS